MFLITAIFIGCFLEVLVYGAYVATFIRHVQILVSRRRKLPPRTFIYLSTASVLLFVLATVSVVTVLIFTTNIFKTPTEPIDFSGYGRKYNIVSGCNLFSLMVADAFLLYRSYILYNSRLRAVALPLLVFMVECGTIIWATIALSQENDGDSDPWTDRPQKLTLAETIFGFISVTVNEGQKVLLLPPSAYAQVGAIIINSAAINLVWLFSVFATSSISSLVYEVFTAPVSLKVELLACVTALIFSTIIVSASRPPSSELSILVSTVPIPDFPEDFVPSNATTKLSADNRLEASFQLVESSSSLDPGQIMEHL
ncbi:hypothetical protein BDP27DRAFT_1429792 [Rhodocollybia butyracea]|uniref:Uncharacterized protein n=1 Tax=Rhodocollybia butyracea TaxID=206335 RepID=A0A9P5PCJ0_9AGAR|nr:hypothetical protein BDP27DRAFT_1429792 [Rhodocollybia butyracea]